MLDEEKALALRIKVCVSSLTTNISQNFVHLPDFMHELRLPLQKTLLLDCPGLMVHYFITW